MAEIKVGIRMKQIAGDPGRHAGEVFESIWHSSLLAQVKRDGKVYCDIPAGAIYEIIEEYPVEWRDNDWRRIDG